MACVHIEQPHAGAPDWCPAINVCASQKEVVVPLVLARMEDGRNLVGIGIDASEISAFVKVTFRAGEG